MLLAKKNRSVPRDITARLESSMSQDLSWGSREPRFDHEAFPAPGPRRFSAPLPGPEPCRSARAQRAIVRRRHCSLARASSFLLRALFIGPHGPDCPKTTQHACTEHPSTSTNTPSRTSSTIGDDRAPELAPRTAGTSIGGRSRPLWLRIKK